MKRSSLLYGLLIAVGIIVVSTSSSPTRTAGSLKAAASPTMSVEGPAITPPVTSPSLIAAPIASPVLSPTPSPLPAPSPSPSLSPVMQQQKEAVLPVATKKAVTISPSPTKQNDTYINVDGNMVQVPTFSDSVPADASARCKDGSYSFSQNRRGTCSGHGGVAQWL